MVEKIHEAVMFQYVLFYCQKRVTLNKLLKLICNVLKSAFIIIILSCVCFLYVNTGSSLALYQETPSVKVLIALLSMGCVKWVDAVCGAWFNSSDTL